MKAFNSLLVAKRWLKEYQVHVGEFDDNSTIQQPDIYQPSEVEISTVQPAIEKPEVPQNVVPFTKACSISFQYRNA